MQIYREIERERARTHERVSKGELPHNMRSLD
jgi:hypothetical protein